MTEEEWLACEDPARMLKYLLEVTGSTYGGPAERDRRPSDRKLRLFACACRRFAGNFDWSLSPEDGKPSWGDMEENPEREIRTNGLPYGAVIPAIEYARLFISEHRPLRADSTFTLQLGAALLRDIVGNPFRPIGVFARAPGKWGGWVTPDVLTLSRAAYEERPGENAHLDPARLAILADALEEVGGVDCGLLSHLRETTIHVRGCWALDLVLGRG